MAGSSTTPELHDLLGYPIKLGLRSSTIVLLAIFFICEEYTSLEAKNIIFSWLKNMLMFFLINSLNAEKLKLFYKDFGMNFKDLDGTKYFYGINNFFIILSKNPSSESRDLYFFKDYKITKLNFDCIDSDEANSILDIYNKVKSYNIIDPTKRAIPIFCSYDIEASSSTHSHLGTWTKEKHRTGPDHYCLSQDGIIVEIYPVRSKCPVENIELAFQGYRNEMNIAQTIIDPDGNNIILLD